MCPCIGGCSGIVTSFGTTATSQINSYANSVNCLSDLALPLAPPFFEDFPTGILDTSKWIYNDGTFINTAGTAEPSPPNSLNLDAIGSVDYQDDEIRTNFIDLSGMQNDGVMVSYFTQHKGVEAGKTLTVDYWAFNRWNELRTIVSDGVNQTSYTQWIDDLTGLVPSPFHSEFRLRFQVDVASANDDWYLDDVFVGTDVVEPPPNDNCADAIAISSGATAFTTVGATADGAPTTCTGGAGLNFDNDIWYRWVSDCFGTVTFSVCNNASFDTRLAVYGNLPCTPTTPISCSDNADDCGTTSEVSFLVAAGDEYIIRIGSPDQTTTGEGTGTLTITCQPFVLPCPWDCADSNGDVNTIDFFQLIAEWGLVGSPCDFDNNGVDVVDFFDLIGHWGPCPSA
jgi:hypothetical protein